VNTTSPNQNPQLPPWVEEIKETYRKKTKSGSKIVLRLGYLGAFGVLCTLAGGVCMEYSIGINPLVDWLAGYASGIGFIITVLVLFSVFIVFIISICKLNGEVVLQSVILFFVLLVSFAIFMPAMGKLPKRFYRDQCEKHLREVMTSLEIYRNRLGGRFPGVDWCDILTEQCELDTEALFCYGQLSGSLDGISSYALNDKVIGKERSKIPSDTVILFETDVESKDSQYSMTETRRRILRYSHPEKYYPTGKVKEGQWNQVGGVEIVSCSHHAGLGCNVLFADGHVEFVRKKDIPKLRWKPEGN
jgi:prepilin-type processing-associated H-X9-DG protein